MKAKRRRHDPEFNARVALEAIKGIKTVQQIVKEFDILPDQVTEWKRAMLEGASGALGAGAGEAEAEDVERERKDLDSNIGQLTVEVDFLREGSRQLGL